MDGVLWYVLASTRGGENRARILRAVDERPRNANQLAEDLSLDYTTVRHHLDVLVENNVVESSGDGYGQIFLPTDQCRANWETVEEVFATVLDGGADPGGADGDDASPGDSATAADDTEHDQP